MKNKNNIIYDYQRDFDHVVKEQNEETARTVLDVNPFAPTIEERISEIHRRINQLAMFVGMPYRLPLDGNLTLYPARKNGTRKVSEEAVSYIVDLTSYRNVFSEVRFKAVTSFCDDSEIVRGVIIDDFGDVECGSDNRVGTSNPWTRLPISEKSSYLVASVPLKDGKPAWVPTYVELLPNGLTQEVANITDRLFHDVMDIENSTIPLKRECEKLLSKFGD